MLGYFIILVILVLILFNFISDYYKGLYVSIFFLILMPPNSTIELSATLPSFTIHRLILFLWFIVWLRNKKIEKKLSSIPFMYILLSISAAFLISTILSSQLLVSIKRFFYFLIESILFFWMLQTSISNKTYIRKIVLVVSASLLVVALIGLIENYSGFNPSPFLGEKMRYDFERSASARASDVISTYLHRILFGTAMVIGMTNFLFLVNRDNTRLQNLIFWGSFFINSAGLYFSLSRGPWLAFIVSQFFLIIIAPRELFKKGIFLLIMVLFIFLMKPGTKSTILSLARSTGDETSIRGASFRWRFIIWNLAYTRITQTGSFIKTLFGFGGGSHIFMTFGRVMLTTGHSAEIESWDSEFAVVLFEQGFIGFILLIFLYLKVFFKGIPYCIKKKKDSAFMQLALTNIVVFFVMKTNVRIYAPQLIYLEFINLAIVSSMLSKIHRQETVKPEQQIK